MVPPLVNPSGSPPLGCPQPALIVFDVVSKETRYNDSGETYLHDLIVHIG